MKKQVDAIAVIDSMKDFFFILESNFQAGDLSLTENLRLVKLIEDMERYVKNQ